MTFLARVLEPPSYGFERDGKLYAPSCLEIWREFLTRINIVSSKKNWLNLTFWVASLAFAIPLFLFFKNHFSWSLLAVGLVYSMVVLGSYGTFWFHRYCTHRAFNFRYEWIKFFIRNAVIKIVPEETYVVSHHVHHRFSEQPGDPYNVHCGWLYCFLADVNHQAISRDLSEKDYAQLCRLLAHAGMRLNTYAQYRRWGTLCHPLTTIAHYVFNWTFWYFTFSALGGTSLAIAIFGLSGVWAIGIRTFNFDGHGRGKDRRRDGIDFNRMDLSINQVWPGYVAGEWHNNHHLYPNGARCGLLPYQLDLPWLAIRSMAFIGLIDSYRDPKVEFYRDHVTPYRAHGHIQNDGVLDLRQPDQSRLF